MKCPFCSHENTRVIDSRPAEDNNSIRRRRVCDECGKRFTTYEKIETIPLIIIKKDNNREAYDRAKIEAGVLRACHKRPVSAQQITTLVDEVENEIFNREEREIPSGTIGELVMNKLKDLDAVAYVRFASVYREFKDVNTFISGVDTMLYWAERMDEKDVHPLMNQGAVGCMWGYFFDINGNIIDTPLYNRMIIPDRSIFQSAQTRICIASDRFKAKAILGALRGGMCNVLITNSKIASQILNLDAV